jgi:hypothetical protein
MKTFALIALALLILSAFPCQGQVIPSMVFSSMRYRPGGELEIRATYKMEPGPIPALSGRPYSAKRLIQTDQELSDGAKISRQSPTVLYYRNSAGSLRFEWPFVRKPNNARPEWDLPVQIEIIDVELGCHYVLDTVHRVAHRGAIEINPIKEPPPSQTATPGRLSQPGESARAQSSTESLGGTVIDGIALQGTRTTTTYPAGSRIGNDRPITTTSEIWDSPELGVPLFRKSSDPRSGDEKAAYFDVSLTEPDASLFQVPADYKIVDEPGPFAITFKFRLNKSGKLDPVQ